MPCYATLSMASLGEEEVVMKLKTYIYTLFMSLGISDERCCRSGSVSFHPSCCERVLYMGSEDRNHVVVCK